MPCRSTMSAPIWCTSWTISSTTWSLSASTTRWRYLGTSLTRTWFWRGCTLAWSARELQSAVPRPPPRSLDPRSRSPDSLPTGTGRLRTAPRAPADLYEDCLSRRISSAVFLSQCSLNLTKFRALRNLYARHSTIAWRTKNCLILLQLAKKSCTIITYVRSFYI